MRRTAIALAAALAAAGCATTPPPPRFKPTDTKALPGAPAAYRFTIGFAGTCPTSATPDWANCNTNLPPNASGQPKDCTWIPYNATVEFAGAGQQFGLEFDPFGRSSIAVNGTTGPLSIVNGHKPAGASHHHVFRVTAAGCNPLDPEIIINW